MLPEREKEPAVQAQDTEPGSNSVHEVLPKPWAIEAREVLRRLNTTADEGLTQHEAGIRLRRHGMNLLKMAQPRRVMAIVADQFKSAVILLLGAAAVVAATFGNLAEAAAILAVIMANTAIGFVTEWRAVRSMEALRQLGRFETVVRRNGRMQKVHSDSLVPGDIVIMEGGDIITADLRLIEASKLQSDESALTGESIPVNKQTEALAADTELPDRSNLLFKGTSITRGSGVGVVVSTGIQTELGRISRLVAEADAQATPLEKRLNALGRRLVWIMLLISAAIGAAGILSGRELMLAIEIAIALAVAAIPEGLPIVATIALARGMRRMARRSALITRLSAVETLGATGVILTDKTGTLTENRMTVSSIELAEHTVTVGGTGLETGGTFTVGGAPASENVLALVDGLLQAAALCNNASLHQEGAERARVVGDPTETALLVAAAKRGIGTEMLRRTMRELREEPFEPETKLMATFNAVDTSILVSVKGAPEAILAHCTLVRTLRGDLRLDEAQRHAILERAHTMGLNGLRTLGVATRTVSGKDMNPYEQLTYLGTVGLLDPPRPGVKEAIRRFRDAGVRVIMVTGDHVATARNIALALELIEPGSPRESVQEAHALLDRNHEIGHSDLDRVRVIARASPQQKLGLIARYQNQGNVVAMTGDGINDAPALKKADIGIAMGVRGTAVAREAAAMVLQDDNFSTIGEAIAQGRTIYENIRKFVVYLFSCNISEILIVSLTTIASAPLPLLPLQILFLNLVTDVFPALALGVGRGTPALMTRKPRPADEPLLTREHWLLIGAYGLLMSVTVLAAMAVAVHWLGFDHRQAVTVSFCTLALAQLWHVFNMRDQRRTWLRNEITGNGWIWAAVALCLILVLGAVYVPGLNALLNLVAPGAAGWMLILGMSVVPLLLGSVLRMVCGGARRTAGHLAAGVL